MMGHFDARTPSIARVYDYLLSGKDNFESDRELAGQLIEIYPPIVDIVSENRKFLVRAVTWAANEGIDQYIDLGAGLPTTPSTHETAQLANPRARVVYVDNDPVVVSHLKVLFAKGNDTVAVLDEDVWQPDAVLGSPSVTGSVDLRRPVCLIMCMLLHFLDVRVARSLVRDYAARLAPGSYLVITVGHGTGEVADRFYAAYNARGFATLHNYSMADFKAVFGDLEIVPPGLGPGPEWRPAWPEMPPSPLRTGQVLVGVGRVTG
jgi:O-methyltransferase involved in polyketide biosynthesis